MLDKFETKTATSDCVKSRMNLRLISHETQYAVRADQDGRATELSDASLGAPSLHPSADCRDQLNPRLSCRVRDCRPCRAQGCRATAGSRRRYSRPPAPRDRPCVSCGSRQSVAGTEGP